MKVTSKKVNPESSRLPRVKLHNVTSRYYTNDPRIRVESWTKELALENTTQTVTLAFEIEGRRYALTLERAEFIALYNELSERVKEVPCRNELQKRS